MPSIHLKTVRKLFENIGLPTQHEESSANILILKIDFNVKISYSFSDNLEIFFGKKMKSWINANAIYENNVFWNIRARAANYP